MDSPKAGHWGLPLKTVERYDPDTDVWTEVASMNEARFGCAVAAYQVNVFILDEKNGYDVSFERLLEANHS